MKTQSRRVIFVGIGFLIAPPPSISSQTALSYQQAFLSQGLEYQDVKLSTNQIELLRESPSPLRVAIGLTPEPQIGQVSVVGENLKSSLFVPNFIAEAEAALNAFEAVWPISTRQIIRSDATIRELHETSSQHAFQELWEQRLGQSSQALAIFGRPIRGGGLRFVMEPVLSDENPSQVEVKIESLLSDTSKIFVETQFIWPAPTVQGDKFKIRERLEQMNEYIEKQIISFISGQEGSNDLR